MLHMLHDMAIGDSGRVVMEIDPDFKREFYGTLTREGLTLKQWFLKQAKQYVEQSKHPLLFDANEMESKKLIQ